MNSFSQEFSFFEQSRGVSNPWRDMGAPLPLVETLRRHMQVEKQAQDYVDCFEISENNIFASPVYFGKIQSSTNKVSCAENC